MQFTYLFLWKTKTMAGQLQEMAQQNYLIAMWGSSGIQRPRNHNQNGPEFQNRLSLDTPPPHTSLSPPWCCPLSTICPPHHPPLKQTRGDLSIIACSIFSCLLFGQVRLGANLVLTCMGHANTLELVRDLEWRLVWKIKTLFCGFDSTKLHHLWIWNCYKRILLIDHDSREL